MQKILILFLSLFLTACASNWPDEGTGGYVETHGLEHEQINALEEKIDLLERCGARRFAAIEFLEADTTLTFMKRSHYAGDYSFAQREYYKTLELVKQIEKRLPNKKCFFPPQDLPSKIIYKSNQTKLNTSKLNEPMRLFK